MAKVNTQHPAYAGLQLKRDVFEAVRSTDCIRACSTKFLPQYPAEDDKDYQARLKASTIDGIVMGGVDTLCGSVFYGDIDTTKVNTAIQPHLTNIDNEGQNFNVFARKAFEASFDGVSCIIVDTPKVDKGLVRSLEDEKVLGIRPYWRLYKAKDIHNWRYQVDPVSKETYLAMIVFYEEGEEIKDRFERVTVKRYRVFDYSNGVVTWQLWRKKDTPDATGEDYFVEDEGVIENVTAIPVSFVGKLTDDPKLLVEARLEVKAYQKESSFDQIEYLSVPSLYTKGYPNDGPPLSLGAGAHIKLPADPAAEVGYIQIDAAGHESLKGTIQNIKEYIKGRLDQMVQSAAAPMGGNKTATQVITEDSEKQARLRVWAEELEEGLETALMFHAQQMGLGEDEGGEIELKTKWAAMAEQQQMMQDAAQGNAAQGNATQDD